MSDLGECLRCRNSCLCGFECSNKCKNINTVKERQSYSQCDYFFEMWYKNVYNQTIHHLENKSSLKKQ